MTVISNDGLKVLGDKGPNKDANPTEDTILTNLV